MQRPSPERGGRPLARGRRSPSRRPSRRVTITSHNTMVYIGAKDAGRPPSSHRPGHTADLPATHRPAQTYVAGRRQRPSSSSARIAWACTALGSTATDPGLEAMAGAAAGRSGWAPSQAQLDHWASGQAGDPAEGAEADGARAAGGGRTRGAGQGRSRRWRPCPVPGPASPHVRVRARANVGSAGIGTGGRVPVTDSAGRRAAPGASAGSGRRRHGRGP